MVQFKAQVASNHPPIQNPIPVYIPAGDNVVVGEFEVVSKRTQSMDIPFFSVELDFIGRPLVKNEIYLGSIFPLVVVYRSLGAERPENGILKEGSLINSGEAGNEAGIADIKLGNGAEFGITVSAHGPDSFYEVGALKKLEVTLDGFSGNAQLAGEFLDIKFGTDTFKEQEQEISHRICLSEVAKLNDVELEIRGEDILQHAELFIDGILEDHTRETAVLKVLGVIPVNRIEDSMGNRWVSGSEVELGSLEPEEFPEGKREERV